MRILSRTAAAVFLLLLSTCLLALAACHARFDLFAFEVDGPGGAERAVELRESPGAPPEREGLLEPSGQRRGTPVYRLAKPVTVGGEDPAFVIGYASDIDSLALTVFKDRDEPLLTVELPPTGDLALRRQAALKPGSRIWGFRIEAGPGEGSLALRAAGLEPLAHGFRFDPDGLTLDGSVEVTAASPTLRASLSAGLRDEMRAGQWQIELEIPEGDASIGLSAPGSTSTVSASFEVPADGPRRVFLHGGSVGFLPRDLRVSAGAASGEPAVRSCRISFVPGAAPIPADPGLILGWRRFAWRDGEAEVFAWPRLPGVLIYDTATYEVQERFFRRLAFFVEKPETAGTIPSLASVEGRRSWNAHDYRAEDLARFFSLAGNAPLTDEESRLREALLAHGVIRGAGSSYEPGEGAVLSISRESTEQLRELLVTHEAFHGVFFTLPAYREACRSAWDALAEDEREVWLAFFDLKGYNTADPYLMVNEFQSYLLQQERAEVQAFQAVTLRRVRDAYPAFDPAVRRIERDRPSSFLDAFDALDRALAEAGGPPGGRVVGVRRAAP
jgi:hypothetical protein